MKYKVQFEFYGRKMQTEVEATSGMEAKNIISNKIIFHKVIPISPDVDFIKDFFGFK